MPGMFIDAGNDPAAIADLHARVASLNTSMRELQKTVNELNERLNQALDIAGQGPTMSKSNGTDSGEKAK